MFMRRPSYLGEDSGGQAIVGESSQIVKQYWNNPKIVSQTVSHWLSESPNSLLLMQLELEARVGIGQLPSRLLIKMPDFIDYSSIISLTRLYPF